MHEYTPVHGFITSGERVTGVQTAAGPVHADHVVIAAGAWSRLLGDHLGIALPLKPTRGQVMVLETYNRPLQRVAFGAGGYLAPKQDGRIVVGATEEDAGFERENTPGGVAFLVKVLHKPRARSRGRAGASFRRGPASHARRRLAAARPGRAPAGTVGRRRPPPQRHPAHPDYCSAHVQRHSWRRPRSAAAVFSRPLRYTVSGALRTFTLESLQSLIFRHPRG